MGESSDYYSQAGPEDQHEDGGGAESLHREISEQVGKKISDVLREIKEKERIDEIFDNPEIKSYTSLDYQLPEHGGRELRAGHRLVFVIPERFLHRIVRDVILKHRKGEKYRVDIGPNKHDPYGAYSEVLAHDARTDGWYGWRDPKGYDPVKFAEPRPSHDPENEVLHDWIATVGEIEADAICVTNVGNHPEFSTSQIHGLEVVFFPEMEGVDYQERIYTPGTNFIDLEKKRLLPQYGGGSHTEGIYEGAMALNQSREALYELGREPGSDAELVDGKLLVDLPPGKSLVQAEVSVGDTEHQKEVSYKTGRRTRLGYAKLWVGIERGNDKEVEWFIQNANIPPQGVIAGGPHLERAKIEAGDRLVIESRQDTAYVMGWRLAYK
jgi:hypothetical protein